MGFYEMEMREGYKLIMTGGRNLGRAIWSGRVGAVDGDFLLCCAA